MAKENMVGTSVRLPRELVERLEAMAARSQWNKGDIHRQALEMYLTVLESGKFLAPWFPLGNTPAESESRTFEPGLDFMPAIDLVAMMCQLDPGAERGALVPFRDLRKIAGISKEAFDSMVLELGSKMVLSLHRHDFALSLSEAERAVLVASPQGDFYVGCAIRQT